MGRIFAVMTRKYRSFCTMTLTKMLPLLLCAGLIVACHNSPEVSQPAQNIASEPATLKIAVVPESSSTVMDYFVQIPAKYIQPRFRSLSGNRDQLLQLCNKRGTCDSENGYIDLGSIMVTLFSRSSGAPIVAVSQSIAGGENVVFLNPDQNWSDVTSEIVPGYSDRLSYELPRHGTTIVVRKKQIKEGRPTFPFPQAPPIYNLVWKKGVFEQSP